MHARCTWIAVLALAACGSRDTRSAAAPNASNTQEQMREPEVRQAPALDRSEKAAAGATAPAADTDPASAKAAERSGETMDKTADPRERASAEEPSAPARAGKTAGEPTAENAAASAQGSGEGAKSADASAAMMQAKSAAAPRTAPFRARPGRKLVGTSVLEETERGDKLAVKVRDVQRGVTRLRLFRAEDCAAFGAGRGRFTSMNVVASDQLALIGDLSLSDGQGAREFPLPAAPAPNSVATAIVAYAPIPAHGGEVAEPIACAQLPPT